jgi:hypothetical protein
VAVCKEKRSCATNDQQAAIGQAACASRTRPGLADKQVISLFPLTFKGSIVKKLNSALAILAASLVLTMPFGAYAQSDQQMDAKFNTQVYMKMADKDGMMKKADVMKVVSDKFDKMQKGGKISVDQMEKMLKDLYYGHN